MARSGSAVLTDLSVMLGQSPGIVETGMRALQNELGAALLSGAIQAIQRKTGGVQRTLNARGATPRPGSIGREEIYGAWIARMLITGSKPHRITPRTYQEIRVPPKRLRVRRGALRRRAVRWTNNRGETWTAAYAPHPGTKPADWRQRARDIARMQVLGIGLSLAQGTREVIIRGIGRSPS